ncbi:hypothetical protein BDW69DRAFT_188959 [Aspergillus filifer]
MPESSGCWIQVDPEKPPKRQRPIAPIHDTIQEAGCRAGNKQCELRHRLTRLSYELFDQILLYLASPVEYKLPPKPNYLDLESTFPSTPNKWKGLAQYAAVSKKWKEAVERFTSNTLGISSDDFLRLSMNMRHFNRWHSLRNLFCTIQLPSYSYNRRSNFERRREHEANLVRFRNALPLLFQATESYQNFHRASSNLRLAIIADAPVKPPQEEESDELEHRYGQT